jgi:hypothetical protein
MRHLVKIRLWKNQSARAHVHVANLRLIKRLLRIKQHQWTQLRKSRQHQTLNLLKRLTKMWSKLLLLLRKQITHLSAQQRVDAAEAVVVALITTVTVIATQIVIQTTAAQVTAMPTTVTPAIKHQMIAQ